MPINGMDHVNIRTRDPEATIAFYKAALGLTQADPEAVAKGAGPLWLYDASGYPIIHLWPEDEAPPTEGPIHHVALSCTDHEGVARRLEAADIPYRINDLRVRGFYQMFVRDPSGVMLELNFRDA